jgi:membrane fusion protein (multidrug efflux system)
MPPTPVEVSDVRPQVVRDEFHALGTLEAQEIIQVVSELSATVRDLRFTEGQPVARGATLVVLDDREIRAEAERSAAQSELAKSNFDRAQKLRDQQVVSQQELDDRRTALKVAEANEALASARLDKTRVRAPWSGLIGRRKVSPGAYVSPGDPIAELARVDEMKVAFAAPERYLAELRRGVAIQLATPAFPDENFRGKVTVVDPIVDPNSRTVQLVAQVSNPDRRLRPGMSANITVTLAERGNALVVPDESVFAEGAQSYVYVVNRDSTVTRTPVELGSRDSSHVEVMRGLTQGVQVVRAGHQKLFDGAHVVPVASLAAAPAGAPGAPHAQSTKKGDAAAAEGPDAKDDGRKKSGGSK